MLVEGKGRSPELVFTSACADLLEEQFGSLKVFLGDKFSDPNTTNSSCAAADVDERSQNTAGAWLAPPSVSRSNRLTDLYNYFITRATAVAQHPDSQFLSKGL